MNEKQIVRAAMETLGWNQTVLAEKCGYVDQDGKGRQSSVSSRLNGSSMRVDTLVKLLDAMGYRITVESKNRDNKNKWTIEYDD